MAPVVDKFNHCLGSGHAVPVRIRMASFVHLHLVPPGFGMQTAGNHNNTGFNGNDAGRHTAHRVGRLAKGHRIYRVILVKRYTIITDTNVSPLQKGGKNVFRVGGSYTALQYGQAVLNLACAAQVPLILYNHTECGLRYAKNERAAAGCQV